jgi:hypothetical protein
MSVKMALLAPIPSARDRIATIANSGLRRRPRMAYRRSAQAVLMCTLTEATPAKLTLAALFFEPYGPTSTWSPRVLIEAVCLEPEVPEHADERRTDDEAEQSHQSRMVHANSVRTELEILQFHLHEGLEILRVAGPVHATAPGPCIRVLPRERECFAESRPSSRVRCAEARQLSPIRTDQKQLVLALQSPPHFPIGVDDRILFLRHPHRLIPPLRHRRRCLQFNREPH